MSMQASRDQKGNVPQQMDRKMDQANGITRSLATANEQAWLYLGTIAEMMGDDDNTILSYEKVLTHNRMNSKALYAIGCCYEKREHYPKASECFRGLVTMNSANGEAWGHLGYCYLMQNDLQNAYTAYQHALYHIQNPKDPNLWYGIGMLYDRYGSLDHAEEAFDAVLQMDPNSDLAQEVKFRLGIIAKQRGYYDQALDRLRQVLEELKSADLAGDVWSQIGHVYELKNEIQLAKSSYQKVVEHNPNNAKALQQLGWLCLKSGTENSAAIEYLKKAVSADPKDGKGWYLLGRCYMVINECEEAYHAYKQAVNCDPSNPNVWCSLGVLFYQLNQYLDALDAYSRAINLNPNICEVWYNVGTLYDTCNQTSDARDAYQKAAELGADGQFIRERLEMLRAKENGQPPLQGMSTAPPGPSEPPTTAPMGVGLSPAKNNGQFQGGAPAPLMPSPATSSSSSGPPVNVVSSSMTSSSMNSNMGRGSMAQPIPTSSRMPSTMSNSMASGGHIPRGMPRGPPPNMTHGAPMRSMGSRLPMGIPPGSGGGPGLGQMMPRGPMPGMMSMGPRASMPMSSQQGHPPAPRRNDGAPGYPEQGDKKLAPTRLAGLDPKTLGRGIPGSRDRLPMPPMADAKRGGRH